MDSFETKISFKRIFQKDRLLLCPSSAYIMLEVCGKTDSQYYHTVTISRPKDQEF